MTQGTYWLLTIPQHEFTPYLPPGVSFIKGQLEQGNGTGFIHWQVLAVFKRSVRLRAVRTVFGPVHAELSRSAAADAYVWKDDTAVAGTRFSLGTKPLRRNVSADWENVWECAKRGDLDSIPGDVKVRYFGNLCRIGAMFAQPLPIERECYVYWGKTGVGKSRRAWDEAGLDSYPKDPRTKFWCGYRSHEHVVVDEFRGGIDIGHLLRWLDRYPVLVEVKGSSVILVAKKIWITSNLSPKEWYPGLDPETLNALLRRIKVTHFDSLYFWQELNKYHSSSARSARDPDPTPEPLALPALGPDPMNPDPRVTGASPKTLTLKP